VFKIAIIIFATKYLFIFLIKVVIFRNNKKPIDSLFESPTLIK